MTDKTKNPNAGHRARMRARFAKTGLEAMADHEVLEMLLYYALPRKDTNKLAHGILKEFGSLHSVFEASAAEIQKRCGLTENTAVLLALVAPLARRYNLSKWGRRVSFKDAKSLGEYVNTLFIGETSECFYMLCLDNQVRLICTTMLEKGTLDRTELYPREIVGCALHNNAAYVILAHNHPSGGKTISNADLVTTDRIIKLLAEVEVGVLDHIICCGNDYVSLAEKRLLGLRGVGGAAKEKKTLTAASESRIKPK